MNRELLIDGTSSEITIALLEDKKLVEIHKDLNETNYAVGDVYLAKVKKTISGLNAAFVDVGYDKDAFLHYLDLGQQIVSCNKFVNSVLTSKNTQSLENFSLDVDIPKNGRITQVLNVGQKILVRIAKEPISSKGPRVTSEVSLPGRFLVLVPFSNKISISQKIKDAEERNRLKRLVQSIRPNNFGVIVRTVAENRRVAELDNDLSDLINKWNEMIAKIPTSVPPFKVHGELGRSFTMLRDMLNETFNNIHVNNVNLYDEIKEYIKGIAPGREEIVKLHKSKTNIFEHFGVDKQIKSSFGKKVLMKNGSYLIIEHTEAFHVIDVNSGHQWSDDKNQEANALEVNLEAAEEVTRQLRLRDMGGIIVIDFIDMNDGQNRRKLYEKIKQLMNHDRAKHSILPPSKFGLVQITRQRVRPETNIEVLEQCPACLGTGKIKPGILIIDEIKNHLQYLVREQNEKNITITVHPFIHAYLTKGLISTQLIWSFKYRRKIKIIPLSANHFLEYNFINSMGDKINL